MKLAFNIKTKANADIQNLILDVSKFRCRIKVDFINGKVEAVEVTPENVSEVIEIIGRYFEIDSVDIDTTCEKDVATFQVKKKTEVKTGTSDKKDETMPNTDASSVAVAKFTSDASSEIVEKSTSNTNSETVAETSPDASSKAVEESTIDVSKPKTDTMEDAIVSLIGPTFLTLDKNADFESQIDEFLKSINMSNQIVVKEAFKAACVVKTVKYETIISEIKKQNPKMKESQIKQTLVETFKTWISTNNLTITEQYPKISIIALLKAFKKNYK